MPFFSKKDIQDAARGKAAAHGLSPAEISRSIGLARIALIIGLVFLHYDTFPNVSVSPFRGFDPQEHQAATWLASTILFFFYSVVPLLSMISGWLFFSKAEDSLAAIVRRVRRRFVSLYLPLVVWNVAYLAILYALYRANPQAPLLGEINVNFADAGWKNYLNAVTGLTHTPIGFQFWFVRDLFVTALFAPVFWLALRRAPWLGAALLCAMWLSHTTFYLFFRPDVPFFFYLGAMVRLKRVDVTLSLPATVAAAALYLALAGTRALATLIVPVEGAEPLWLAEATLCMRLVGVVACWGVLYRMAQTPWGGAAAKFGGLAFFLHSAHWPLLAFVKLQLWPLLPAETDGWMMVHYVASVTVTVAVGLGLGLGLARGMPRVFSLMNGGRLLEQTGRRDKAVAASAKQG